VVNNDGVVRDRTLSIVTHGFDALRDVANDVADRYDHPIGTVPKLAPTAITGRSSHGACPAVTSNRCPTVRGGAGAHIRGYDRELEPRTLSEQAILLTEYVVALAREDVTIDHRDPDAIAADLESQDLAEGMRITGDWPYDESGSN